MHTLRLFVLHPPLNRGACACAAVAALLVASCLVAGCGESPPVVQRPGSPVVPGSPDLKSPQSAVRSYLDWTTLAYRLANSEAASRAMDPYEGVRVDSYIAYLRETENKALDRSLSRFEVLKVSREGTRALVAARETWRYRYFSLSDLRYLSPSYSTSYDTTYTVTHDSKRGWLVARVQAKALDAVR